MATRQAAILPGTNVGGMVGTFNVDFAIGSANGDRTLPLVGMVDTGSLYSVIPGVVLEELGIARDETEFFGLADGSIIEMSIGLALIEIDGRSRTVHVAFGHDDEIILIGAMTLERFGVAADPVHARLVPARVTL
jgi:predicted aspartyl protease